MASTPIELGALLDRWAPAGQVGIVETAAAVTISRMGAAEARELLSSAAAIRWRLEIQDAAGEPCDPDVVDDDFGPFIGTLHKEPAGADLRVLTLRGFAQALASGDAGGVWQVACNHIPFASGTISVNPWGAGEVFAPSPEVKSPLDVVREASESRLVPSDIRRWLLRTDISDVLWADSAFQVFAEMSSAALVRSIASEVVGRTAVVFNGPPRLNSILTEADLASRLGAKGYRNIRAAAAWVYEDRVSTEQRHTLFASEVARSVKRDEDIGEALREAGKDVLDGARLAFQLSQSDLSREAIKAQGDLRKAIADDTAKAADSARTVAGAIAVAIATGIGLVAARSTGQAEPWVLSVIACVVAAYLAVVAVAGWLHLRLQHHLREQWKRRFYRFIPAEDYKAMVTEPAKAAELPYHMVAVAAIVVAVALVSVAFGVLGRGPVAPIEVPASSSNGRQAKTNPLPGQYQSP